MGAAAAAGATMQAARAVVLFGLFLLALVWGGIAVSLRAERDDVLADARADAANLARAFDEHIQRTIAGLDQTLLYLRAEFRHDPAHFDISRSVANNVILRRVSVQIGRIGADGWLKDSNLPGFQAVDLSDREHFLVQRDGGRDDLFVSKPVLGRTSGKWSIQLTRRLDDAAGNFAGVLVISLDPHYLGAFYGAIDLGEHGAVALIGRDGVLRVASNGGDAILGRRLEDGPLLDAVRDGVVAPLESSGPLDDRTRLISVRPLGTLPLSVVVGQAKADVLAAFHQAVIRHLLIGGLVTLALGGAVLLLYRLVRRQEAIAADLTVKKAELVVSRLRLRRYVADLERIAEVAAHDLQEPLRRVVAYAQLLSGHVSSALDDEGRGYVAHVVEGAQRMRKLVKDLEAFVAVDQIPAAEGEIAAAGAVAAAMDRLGEQIRATGATVVVETLPAVAVDERVLTEIFTQLLDNALRYRRAPARPLVRVSARDEGQRLVFSVADNGRGISAGDRVRLFEIFHRLESIDGHPGTGIGLAMVRRMIEHLGGRVWVESEPGRGSTFSFSLPRPLAVPPPVLGREARAA